MKLLCNIFFLACSSARIFFLLQLCCMQFFSSNKRLQENFFWKSPILPSRAKWSAPKGPGKRGHIVADILLPTQMFPRLPARATFVANTKNVSDFVQFAQPKKHHEQHCVRNNVSSFASTLMTRKSCATGMRTTIPRNNLKSPLSSPLFLSRFVEWKVADSHTKKPEINPGHLI